MFKKLLKISLNFLVNELSLKLHSIINSREKRCGKYMWENL